MKFFEFKRLALSDPYSKDPEFLEQCASCSDCSEFLSSVRKMDSDLSSSLDVEMPADLVAKLKLNTEISIENESPRSVRHYAVAASFALALFVAGFMFSNQFTSQPGVNDIHGDYLALISGVAEHMDDVELTPVWDTKRANDNVNTLLASYDGQMQLKYMENLQFGKICPMGRYRGLHATLETSEGVVTFAYIKGDSVGDLLDASYEGYMSRVKPVRGGNIVILSESKRALDEADGQLKEAMHWDI